MGPEELMAGLKPGQNTVGRSRKSAAAGADPIQEEFVKPLLAKLPPVIARKDVDKHLGGMISAKTLSNADSAGHGPKNSYKVGTSVVYLTESLLQWLVEHQGVSRRVNINNL